MGTATPIPIRRSVRLATMTRWRAALIRAFQKGISLRYEASTGMAVVSSSSDSTFCYVTDGRICTCQAGRERRSGLPAPGAVLVPPGPAATRSRHYHLPASARSRTSISNYTTPV